MGEMNVITLLLKHASVNRVYRVTAACYCKDQASQVITIEPRYQNIGTDKNDSNQCLKNLTPLSTFLAWAVGLDKVTNTKYWPHAQPFEGRY